MKCSYSPTRHSIPSEYTETKRPLPVPLVRNRRNETRRRESRKNICMFLRGESYIICASFSLDADVGDAKNPVKIEKKKGMMLSRDDEVGGPSQEMDKKDT